MNNCTVDSPDLLTRYTEKASSCFSATEPIFHTISSIGDIFLPTSRNANTSSQVTHIRAEIDKTLKENNNAVEGKMNVDVIKTIINKMKLINFAQFKKNWDCYDADPINQEIIQIAKKFITGSIIQPKVFPTGRSTIQFEYDYINDYYLEIEILSKEKWHIYIKKGDHEEEYETENVADVNRLVEEYHA
jgi:hypothetical protein